MAGLNCVNGINVYQLSFVVSINKKNYGLQVVFNGWMKQHDSILRFERYADDLVIHTISKQIAKAF